MSTITREELKEKLDGGGDFKLVNCLDDWMFRAKRIPGSIHFERLKHALDTLDPKEEVIVDHGFQNLNITSITRFRSAPQSPNVRHNAPGLRAVSRAAADALLASEANVISLVEV